MLVQCKEKNLVLNWEKCHFMVRKGIVLGHVISESGIELLRLKTKLTSAPIVRLNLFNHVLALFLIKFACNSAFRNPVFRWELCKGSV